MIKYRGGKSKEISNILWHIPRFTGRYVEPFFGGGALFFYLEPQRAVINDINAKLMNFYRGVRDSYSDLRRELDEVETLYEYNRKAFEALKSATPDERVEDANERLYYELRDMFNGIKSAKYSEPLLYYFINKTAYSGMVRYNTRGEFNVPFGRYAHFNTSAITKSHSLLLQKTEIYNASYDKVFDMCKDGDFLFLDPPYDCVFSDYGNDRYKDGFTEDDHRRLANDFANLSCQALMVIGRTPLTEGLYDRFVVDEYEKVYAVNIRNRFKSAATHLVVANYRESWSNRCLPGSCRNYAGGGAKDIILFDAGQTYGKNR